MAVIPLVPETKMVDVGKLIYRGNLLVRKVRWFVLTTTSAPLVFISRIWSRPHDKDCLYIFSSSKNPLSHILISRDSTLSLHFDFQKHLDLATLLYSSIRVTWMDIYSATFFLPVLPFRLDLFQPRTQPQKFRQIPKETNNQHGRRHVPSRIHCYISVY